MLKIKELFRKGIYDQWISKAMDLIKIIFLITLCMSILSLLFVIFPKTGYHGRFQTTVPILDALPYIVFYGTFYIIIFLAFPATVILLVIYMMYKYVRRESLEIKPPFRLIIWNIAVLLFVFLIGYLKFSCETKSKKNISKNLETEKPIQDKIETENRTFFVGDIDNDKVNDTAFVNYKWNIETNEIECEKNNCDIDIEFKKNIPKISFTQSLGIVVSKTEDVNNDNSNEIIIFSRTNEGWWNNISVWSFKHGTWNKLAETNAFLSDDKDFENRIVNEKGNYYLIGDDKWNEDENGNFKKVKVRL